MVKCRLRSRALREKDKTMSTSKTQNYSFEEAMQVLDASLAALSQGDLPLEKAIEAYKAASRYHKGYEK